MMPDVWLHEARARERGFSRIAGVDEAGRGPLAGPVVAAAVVLPGDFSVAGVTDSKKLTPKKRALLYDQILVCADGVGVGVVSAEEIDRINILQASLEAMRQAVSSLGVSPDFLLIDGSFGIASNIAQMAIPKGDALSISIGAASIVAKVTRDRLMTAFHAAYPQYAFDRHKGYPTRDHRRAIERFGCCAIHRKSFRGVKEYL